MLFLNEQQFTGWAKPTTAFHWGNDVYVTCVEADKAIPLLTNCHQQNTVERFPKRATGFRPPHLSCNRTPVRRFSSWFGSSISRGQTNKISPFIFSFPEWKVLTRQVAVVFPRRRSEVVGIRLNRQGVGWDWAARRDHLDCLQFTKRTKCFAQRLFSSELSNF